MMKKPGECIRRRHKNKKIQNDRTNNKVNEDNVGYDVDDDNTEGKKQKKLRWQ